MKINQNKIEINIGEGIEASIQQFLIELRKTVMTMTNAGMSVDEIKAVLARQAEGGTGAIGGFKKNIRDTVTAGINEAANEAIYSDYKNAGVKKYRWVTVSKNPCPDCIERHGQVETWEDWELIGLPKSGFSVCQENCKCQLLPVDYTGKGLDQPIIRLAQSPKGQAYSYYRETNITDYVTDAKETLISEEIARRQVKKHPDFAHEMTYAERVNWIRNNPDAIYFYLHKGKKQVVFVREDYYVFCEGNKFKTAFIPDEANIEAYRYKRRYEWIKIPEEKWKTIK